MPSELADKVISLLTPNIGSAVSKSIVTEACKSIKTDIETLDNSKLAPFAEVLEKSLSARMGPAIARKMREKVMEFAGKNTIPEKHTVPEEKMDEGIDKEINTFLDKNILPTENDVLDYAKYLTMKYGGEAKTVEKNLMEKVRIHVKYSIGRKKIKEEIRIFLDNFPHANKNDIDDFIKYTHLLKLSFVEDELKAQIENERLVRKFGGVKEERQEIDKFIDFVKVSNDKGKVGEAMKKQGLTYLIQDESGNTDKSLSDFIELITPSEKDMKEALQSMGLDHLVKK
ncbi:MAG: hypothetical protein Q8M95_09585 [Candidatus Methanoperedens sp.]|nr:hypothetical protein [Candidatus Methanoperedens sp.]